MNLNNIELIAYATERTFLAPSWPTTYSSKYCTSCRAWASSPRISGSLLPGGAWTNLQTWGTRALGRTYLRVRRIHSEPEPVTRDKKWRSCVHVVRRIAQVVFSKPSVAGSGNKYQHRLEMNNPCHLRFTILYTLSQST